MDNQSKTYKDLPYKDKVAYITAICSFFLGWILLFVGLLLPPTGEIAPSVITAFGTALVYTATIFGAYLYVKNAGNEMYNDMMDKLSKKIEEKFQEENGN